MTMLEVTWYSPGKINLASLLHVCLTLKWNWQKCCQKY